MFDYLRLDKFSQQDIRIISAGSDNFLLNERVWDAFITDYWDFMNGVEDEQSVDECIQNATSAEDSKRLLRQRDEKWKKQVSEKLVENFNDKKNIIDSKNEKQKPASLLKRALNALAEIDESTLSTASDLDVVRARISEVLDRMKVLSDAVNS
jgi:hypothetical protein